MFNSLPFDSRVSVSQPYTVSQLNGRIRRLIEDEPALSEIWVEGEVSNSSRAVSGHVYFTMKDAGAQIGCVMWRSIADAQDQLPSDGDLVLAHGRVGVYEAGGRYQLYVDHIRPAGLGDLYLQFEELKERLDAEGLFALERKQALSRFPGCIGVVTSPTAAALQDILNVLARRYPLAEVLLAPTLVQGEQAPAQIVAALEALQAQGEADVIIVARGGGSLEDLWAFNDERVARAIAASPIPIVCGVGHETDYSLADFAADVRAPTPSAAAELVTPDQLELKALLAGLAAALADSTLSSTAARRWRLIEFARALRHLSPATQLAQARQRVDDMQGRAAAAMRHNLALRRERLIGVVAQLGGVSPQATLERGYAVVRRRETLALVRSVAQVAPGDLINVRVSDGAFGAQVAAAPSPTAGGDNG
ncbi:MAG: exodeoxyribonuclease VII large subunit [Anaerolineales bacterium]|nr:MAG: exodeoxyribonuclease VII large subunit [Anaerolineales bacterium]